MSYKGTHLYQSHRDDVNPDLAASIYVSLEYNGDGATGPQGLGRSVSMK